MQPLNPEKRSRGPNKQKRWARPDGLGVVLRLALDVGDPIQRRLIESMFVASFNLRRALQSDARSRVFAFRAARHERDRRGNDAVRERLGLSLSAFERAAYEHLNEAPHLRRYVTKALGMHIADGVWRPIERHLFADASGKRQGLLHVSRWFDFARLPGRAQSRTTERKWETFRLHGTLEGHRAAYTTSDGSFMQPRRLRPVLRPPRSSWWDHKGPLVVVFTGLPAGELAVPVRLPTAPSNQAALDHYLSRPEDWHKVDLVRERDPHAPGGWRYEAHLMVLAPPYVTATTKRRREEAAKNTATRSVGIDVNVSNVTVASHAAGADLRFTRVARDAGERTSAERRAKRDRRRARALERSRRAANADQYELSAKQRARAVEREARGLPPIQTIPKGPRTSHANGRPLRAFRRDTLSARYRFERAAQAAAAAAASRAKKETARRLAGQLTLQHGFRAVIEAGNLTAWARRWGRALHAFSPGMLVDAFEREALAVAAVAARPGGLLRASTATTALSQNCLCGSRIQKTLAERTHRCGVCGVTADRDAMSALLATVVVFDDPAKASSAFVDFTKASALRTAEVTQALARTLDYQFVAKGRQDVPPESTASPARDEWVAETERTSRDVSMMARRNVGTAPRATPDETDASRTTLERARLRTNLSPFRDSS